MYIYIYMCVSTFMGDEQSLRMRPANQTRLKFRVLLTGWWRESLIQAQKNPGLLTRWKMPRKRKTQLLSQKPSNRTVTRTAHPRPPPRPPQHLQENPKRRRNQKARSKQRRRLQKLAVLQAPSQSLLLNQKERWKSEACSFQNMVLWYMLML